MSLPAANCMARKCDFYIGVEYAGKTDETTERHVCSAFPNGIPDEITYGSELHNEPIDGDNGIQYSGDDVAGERARNIL